MLCFCDMQAQEQWDYCRLHVSEHDGHPLGWLEDSRSAGSRSSVIFSYPVVGFLQDYLRTNQNNRRKSESVSFLVPRNW